MDWDPNFFNDAMAQYGMNPYPSEAGRCPSRQGAGGMAHLRYSSIDNQQMNSNRHFIRSPENASYQDGATPLVISPHPDADVNYMLSQALYTDDPRTNNILGSSPQVNVSSHAFARNTGYSSPWNTFHTEADYRDMEPETSDEMFQTMIDQSMFLRVPGHGTAGTARSFSTVGTPYTASSDGRSDVSQERTESARPRGGREQGMRLPEASVQNVRQVRDVGACFRCAVLREKCSAGTPCETCSNVRGRKWAGCIRSFDELTKLLNPDKLAQRLQSQALTRWMSTNIQNPLPLTEFDLPLSFGFGKPFIGFRGIEYIPITNEARWSRVIGYSDESPRYSRSLYVYPVNSSSLEIQKMIWKWLKQTLGDKYSMNHWLRTCFPGSEVKWIRDLLRVTRRYTFASWNGRSQEADDSQLNDNLFEAWMACLIVTMLSLPITVPEDAVNSIVPDLQFVRYEYPYPNTSRALTKCVKSVMFDMYQQLVKRITLALDKFGQLKIEEISERRLAHMNCISILLMVLTSQIQTSLRDDSRLIFAGENDPAIWERTLDQLQNIEGVFKNTILFVRYRNKEWLKKNPESKLLDLRDDIREIGRTYRDAIEGHLNVKLEAFKDPDPNVSFHKANMQRVFAFFFNLECRFGAR